MLQSRLEWTILRGPMAWDSSGAHSILQVPAKPSHPYGITEGSTRPCLLGFLWAGPPLSQPEKPQKQATLSFAAAAVTVLFIFSVLFAE